MLKRIVQFSLRYRGVVLVLACVAAAYGLYVAAHTKLDVFPEFAPPQVVIQTEAPGLSPEEVEALVTRPLENGLNGAPDLVALRSQSIQGLSAITAVFSDRADIYRVRQMVSERLTQVAGSLPQRVKSPKMGPLISSTSKVLALGLTSTNLTPMALRTFADWTARPRLLAVPGVAKVEIFGGEVRQIQIQVRPDRLLAYGLALQDVLAVARQSTAVRGAGFVDNGNQRIVLRTEGQSLTAAQLGEVALAHHNGVSVRLKDVAKVIEGPEPKFGDAQIMGERGVVVGVYSQYGANTMEVTRAVESALAELAPAFASESITVQGRLFRAANFIETSIENVNQSLMLGGLLVAVVLFLFLLDWRTAFISFTSIPLSLLAAVVVLDRCGVSLNTLTLGGFAIAIGVVVDDAIIDVENILRRARQNLSRAQPRPLFQVVLEASLEVRSAVVYATFIVALVFFPILTLTGIQGKLFMPLASAFILAILASLAVALTVTPALCLAMLSRTRPQAEPRYVRWMKAQHCRWLGSLSQRPRTVISVALVMFLAAAATLPFFGGEFLPEFREGHFIVHMAALPGTSLEASLRLGRQVTQGLLKNPHIRSVSQQAGRAENGEDTWGTHYSELDVDLQPLSGEAAEGALGEIRQALEKFPGLTFRVMPFLAERMEETLSGTTAQVVVNIFGDDLEVLDQKAGEVRQALAEISGATDVQIESQPGSPQVVMRLRAERLTQFGFLPVDVLDAVQTAYQGTEVAQTYEGNRVFDVTVILDEASRQAPEEIGALLLRNSEGQLMPLRELAEIYPATGRYLVAHEGARRRQQVTANVAGRDLASFVEEMKQQIAARLSFPAGVYPTFGGSGLAQAAAKRELLLHSAIAGVGIILLLSIVFRNPRNLLLVLVNMPFALIGGVLAVFATGGSLSLGSLVGFVTLFGITTRNSIMMISHFEHLVQEEGLTWGLDAAIRGASERLLPILMTALVTALGLLPLALGAGEAGREIEGPMAMVILGGLLTSTALNLLVLPTLALRHGRFERKAADGEPRG
ncbi:MAG: efflux RND transporter permease subunit [Verrucomicrobiota bacterium]|jgi:CzcA family heavy metal efflux pump